MALLAQYYSNNKYCSGRSQLTSKTKIEKKDRKPNYFKYIYLLLRQNNLYSYKATKIEIETFWNRNHLSTAIEMECRTLQEITKVEVRWYKNTASDSALAVLQPLSG